MMHGQKNIKLSLKMAMKRR